MSPPGSTGASENASTDERGEEEARLDPTEASSDQHFEENEAHLYPAVQARIGSSIRSESTQLFSVNE